ncbi:hypothetical protein F0562_029582 [Nyssa sinensis]|uniref:Uncharacterized protein n=1 Tax=Nyssa sinensis TaxID=561372 RepID=A0A5J5B3I2_9ASTE|nr:hypothetical protein F0562_029582 [Nyssa sinensis]
MDSDIDDDKGFDSFEDNAYLRGDDFKDEAMHSGAKNNDDDMEETIEETPLLKHGFSGRTSNSSFKDKHEVGIDTPLGVIGPNEAVNVDLTYGKEIHTTNGMKCNITCNQYTELLKSMDIKVFTESQILEPTTLEVLQHEVIDS